MKADDTDYRKCHIAAVRYLGTSSQGENKEKTKEKISGIGSFKETLYFLSRTSGKQLQDCQSIALLQLEQLNKETKNPNRNPQPL